MAFSPDYVRLVLSQNFEDAKALFLEPLMAIHRAHLVMLADQKIVSKDDAQAIRAALERVDLEAIRQTEFDGTSEDLFFHINKLLSDGCGSHQAGRLHTARSRNDIDMTMYRIRLREFVLGVADEVLNLRRVLLAVADRHVETIFPAHTHVQPAQPTSLAHYLLAFVEQLERDTVRLQAAFDSTNRNPLGACAITGTGFPIDRDRTSELLGFSAPTRNTYGSIATVDYLLQSAGAVSTLIIGAGRFVQDLLLWSTLEVGYLRLPDELVQVSSIMPQKRNPVPLEHARALGSKAAGQLAAIPAAVHNTPFGDIVDTEDDLQPLVASAMTDATRMVALLRVAVSGAEFNVARMATRAGEGWITVTELADALVRVEGWSFEQAHHLAAALAREPRPADGEVAGLLKRLAVAAGLNLSISDEAITAALDPVRFVDVRKTWGGPSPEVVRRAIQDSRAVLESDGGWQAERRRALRSASASLDRAFAAL